MTDSVAVIIVNFNMLERADALFEYIVDNSKWPCDMIMVDNGSDPQYLSKWTNVRLQKNVQTLGGWLTGLRYAKSMALLENREHLAYMFIITSAEFVAESGDPITPLAEFLLEQENAVAVHAALTRDSTTAHKHMVTRGGHKPRRTSFLDTVASLYRADWLDGIGGFDPRLVYSWGIGWETCWKARKQGRGIWIHEGTKIKKVLNIGYTMNRMGMSTQERNDLSFANTRKVLGARYGSNYLNRLYTEFVKREWR